MKAKRAGGTRPTPWTAAMDTTSFQLNDLFWTLQGEGVHAGQRALFLRLPFCNYNCSWCDTEFNTYQTWTESELTSFFNQEPARLAIITGGEPLMHKDLPRLLKLLKEHGFFTACETNGSVAPPQENLDFITTSPKAFTKGKHPAYYVHPEIFERTNQWKYVVDKDFDWQILERHKNDPETVVHALSPEFNEMMLRTQQILDYIKDNPKWRLSLQTHKWIEIP